MYGPSPTAKRSPSILVTDVRNKGAGPAPFARGSSYKGRREQIGLTPSTSRFSNVSVDGILGASSEIPSGHRRDTSLPASHRTGPNGTGHGYGSYQSPASAARNVASSPTNQMQANKLKQRRTSSVSTPVRTSELRKTVPMTQNLPQRTTKVSEKLVYIPDEAAERNFYFDSDSEREDEGPPISSNFKVKESATKKSYAERMPKDQRNAKFPRVTAYCVADALRLQAAFQFLEEYHNVRPRIYDEALFAHYDLPLKPGNETRVQSGIGNAVAIENLINISERNDHHFEYFSGLERSEELSPSKFRSEGGNGDWNAEFDPSEPQDFSPRNTTSMRRMSNDDTREGEDKKSSSSSIGINSAHGSNSSAALDSSDAGGKSAAQKKDPLSSTNDLNHAQMFMFSYGVIVFWNFTEKEEKDLLADLTFARMADPSGVERPLSVRPANYDEIETEEMHFTYSRLSMRPRIYNDMITLRSGDHMIKLSMSHAIAQSTKLSKFEARMDSTMGEVKHIPKALALTGKLGMKREEVLKFSGRLFKLRVEVNLSSNVLDTPEFFWEDEPSLNPLYSAVREYLEIDQRILVLNERCKVFLELTDILSESIAESNMSRITWIVIWLIVLSLAVTGIELLLRYMILSRGGL